MRIKVAKNSLNIGNNSNGNNNNVGNNGGNNGSGAVSSSSSSSTTTTTTSGGVVSSSNLSPSHGGGSGSGFGMGSGGTGQAQADRVSGTSAPVRNQNQTAVQQQHNRNHTNQNQRDLNQNTKAGGGTTTITTPGQTKGLTAGATGGSAQGQQGQGQAQQGEKKVVATKQHGSRTNSPVNLGTSTSTSTSSSSSSSATHNDGYNSSDELEKPAQKRQLQRLEVDSEGNVWKEVKIGPKKKKLLLKKMAEDGNCLFRAIADQVFGDQEMHGTIRKLCMDYMQAERDHYSQFVTEEFEAYVNRKRKEKCFGNNVEIQAICELYNRPIEVYTDDPVPINIFHASYQTDNAPIRLWYNGINHYNSLVDPYEATIGVGLGLPEFKPGLADKLQMDKAIKYSEDDELDSKYLSDLQRETDLEVTERELEEAAIAASLAEYWQSFSK